MYVDIILCVVNQYFQSHKTYVVCWKNHDSIIDVNFFINIQIWLKCFVQFEYQIKIEIEQII